MVLRHAWKLSKPYQGENPSQQQCQSHLPALLAWLVSLPPLPGVPGVRLAAVAERQADAGAAAEGTPAPYKVAASH